MKHLKDIVIVIITILLIVLVGIGAYKIFFSPKTYTEIKYNKLIKMIDKEDKFVLFIGSEKCSHCATFKTTVNEVVKEKKINIYYIDVSKLTEKEYAYLNSHFPFSGTPTTVIVKDGKEYERQLCRIDGAKDYDYVIDKLTKAGIIKE